MKQAALTVLFAIFASAQPKFDLSVTVLDKATGQPILGAEVLLQWAPLSVAGAQQPPIRIQATTGATGEVRMAPEREGTYMLGVTKAEGFRLSAIRVDLGASQLSQSMRFPLERLASLTGLAVDVETGEPIPNLLVRTVGLSNAPGVGLATATTRRTDDSRLARLRVCALRSPLSRACGTTRSGT